MKCRCEVVCLIDGGVVMLVGTKIKCTNTKQEMSPLTVSSVLGDICFCKYSFLSGQSSTAGIQDRIDNLEEGEEEGGREGGGEEKRKTEEMETGEGKVVVGGQQRWKGERKGEKEGG